MAHTEDLITLLAVAGRPIRVDEAVEALKIEADEVLTAVEQLVDAGHVLDTAEGIAKSENTPEPKSASRTSYLAGKWAEALAALGGDPTEIGLAYLAAGQYQKAADHLVPVALGEATAVAVDAALAAGEHGNFYSKVTEGQLHLSRAAHRSAAGETLAASADLEVAIRNLEGSPLVDALQFAAEVASNLQHPQRSEALAAIGAWQAVHVGEPAKQGSLLTLQARELARLGFPLEADRAMEVGRALVDANGTAAQKDNAHWHAAWVMFDRGEFRNAEAEFSTLRDHAKDGDRVILGAREAYWARALFGTGRAAEALEAVERAEAIAQETGADVPAFIAGLARLEGALNFARYEQAISEAHSVLEIIRRSLPQWENVALVGLARAYAGTGEVDKAREALDAAEASTPAGIDGWRWRLHAQEVRVSLTPDSEPWPQKEAEDLTDALLQARWFDSAAHLMCIRSHREKDPDLGVEAAALALQIGSPMLAARAVESAGVWDDDVAVPVARALRQVEQHVPADWMEEWRSLDSVGHAYEVDTNVEVDSEELTAHIDEALEAAGLAGTDVILSPAQRQAKGLVRRRPRRRLGTGALVGVAAGVAALSVGLAFALFTFLNPTQEVSDPEPTTTTMPRMEDTVVPIPENGVFGTIEFRGGEARTGVFEFGDFRTPLGRYFDVTPGGSFLTDPVAYGRQLIVTTNIPNSELILVNMGSEEANMGERANVSLAGQASSPPAIKVLTQTMGPGLPLLVVGTEDGLVYARNALTGTEIWPAPKSVVGVVKGAPLIVERRSGAEIIVGTDAGVIYSFDIDGRELWTYRGSEEDPLGPIDRPMAFSDDILYVVDQNGVLHLLQLPAGPEIPEDEGDGVLDPSGGDLTDRPEPEPGDDDPAGEDPTPPEPEVELVCDRQYGTLPPASAPIISGGIVYIPLSIGEIWLTEAGFCGRQPVNALSPQIVSTFQFGLQFAPIVHDGVIYLVDNRRLVAIEAKTNRQLEGVFNAESPISGSPVMAGGIIYLGTQDGVLFAVDPETREEIWRFDVGESLFGSPAVVKGNAIFVLTAEGSLIAVAVE
ncbi:MAG: PQQ-binding-like beta-propeller repeat protein [Acidimicrobiia bacterium]|nr:PQQ-binding-like beta-propeller repeat protein [Acidimicrobiia bacterium]